MENDLRNANISGSQFGDGNIINNTTIIKNAGGKRASTVTYRIDQIGGNSDWQGYIHYLAEKLVKAQMESGFVSSFQKVFTLIAREFGNKTFMLPLEKAPDVADFLKKKIDQTKFARGLGHKFYHSFDEHKK